MKKLLSIILAVLMIATALPLAFAAEADGEKTLVDISKGKVVITDSYVTVGGETVEVDPDGYIITGSNSGDDTALRFINDSGSKITFDVVFKDLYISAGDWKTAFCINDNSPVILNVLLQGSTYIAAHNHPAIVGGANQPKSGITINFTTTEGYSLDLVNRYTGNTSAFRSGIVVNIDGKQVGYDLHFHENTDGVKTCKGLLCDTCNSYFGEKDLTTHKSNGNQTCRGYWCTFCQSYYGETIDHSFGEQTCKGYYCSMCRKYYGEAGDHQLGEPTCAGSRCETCRNFFGETDPDTHFDDNTEGFCDGCGIYIGHELKAGEAYDLNDDYQFVRFIPVIDNTYVLTVDAVRDTVVSIYKDTDGVKTGNGYGTIWGEAGEITITSEYTAGSVYYIELLNYNGELIPSMIIECESHIGTTQTCMGYICDGCGEFFGEAAADTHLYTDYKEELAPTCTAEGTEKAYCDYGCGSTDKRATQALGHNIVIDEYKAPDCTQTGLEEGSHCTRCDEMTVAQNKIAALGHTDENGDNICEVCDGVILCESCGRTAHTGFINEVICFVIMFINLIISMFR